MAVWIASMFLVARLLEEVHYRRKVYNCFQGDRPGDAIGISGPSPEYLRKTAKQLTLQPNMEIWCGNTPKDAFAPGDDRLTVIQSRASMSPACFVGWLGVVPTGVPDGWIKSLPSTQAFEALRELDYAWRSYNDEVDKVRFQTCKANEHT